MQDALEIKLQKKNRRHRVSRRVGNLVDAVR